MHHSRYDRQGDADERGQRRFAIDGIRVVRGRDVGYECARAVEVGAGDADRGRLRRHQVAGSTGGRPPLGRRRSLFGLARIALSATASGSSSPSPPGRSPKRGCTTQGLMARPKRP